MSTALLEEDEFAGRDPMGLQVVSEKTETEEQAFKKYLKLLFVFVPILGLSLAIATYVTAKYVGGETIMQVKFHFLRQYQLGYVFLAAWLIGLARAAVALLANSARAAARLDRPDQHVYKIMDASGSLKSAPYVLMATTGAVGRFNRTQRAAYNMDESLPCFLVNTLLASSVFGPVTLLPLLLYCYGRLSFTVKYKKSLKERGAGFLPSMIGEKWIEGLVLLSAIKSLTGL